MKIFLNQNPHFETKSFIELVTKHLIKFEREIDEYFPSLGKNEFAFIRNPFTANTPILQVIQVFKRDWLNSNTMVLHAILSFDL